MSEWRPQGKVLVILYQKVHKVSLAQGTGKGLVSF